MLKQQAFYLLSLLCLKVINDNKDVPYIIPEASKWDKLRISGDIGREIDNALASLEKENKDLKDVFTLFSFKELENKMLYKLLQYFERYSLDRNRHMDLAPATGTLATASEALLFSFSRELWAGFFGPREIGKLLTKLLKKEPFSRESIYDPCAGTGNFLVEAAKHSINPGDVELEGQEINKEISSICIMNFILHGIYQGRIKTGDTLREPKWTEKGMLKKYDYILSDPPFGLTGWAREEAEADQYGRFKYGLPGKTAGDMAFLLHIISSMKENGKAGIVVTNGLLSRGGVEQDIRRRLLEEDIIEAVVSLPGNLYMNTSIPVSVLIINKSKNANRRGFIQFIKATEDYEPGRGWTQNKLRQEDIIKITNIYWESKEIKGYSRFVTLEEIEKKSWKLVPSMYMEEAWVTSSLGNVKVNLENFEKLPISKIKLGDIAEISRGMNISPHSKKHTKRDYTHLLINLKDVENGKIMLENLAPLNTNAISANISKYEVRENDLILACRGSVNKIAVVPKYEKKLVISSNFIRIRLFKNFDPFFIKAFLESPIGIYLLQINQIGTTINMIKPSEVKQIPIPWLPLSKQRQIAEKYVDVENTYTRKLEEAEKEYKEQMEELYMELGISDVYKI